MKFHKGCVNLRFGMAFKKLFYMKFGKLYNLISAEKYMKSYIKYLKQLGVNINGTPNYIAPDVQFDSHFYSYITINDDTVISKEVVFLTHDYSIARGLQSICGKVWDSSNTPHFVKKIEIGKNCFIGARSIILPGTVIGDNCIVGAGSVVRGKIENDSIIIGNPAVVVSKTSDWAKKHIDKGDIINTVKEDSVISRGC